MGDTPASTDQEWTRYHAATADLPPRPLLVRAVTLQSAPGAALDLGCGAGNDTRYLVARGYTVTAVDANPSAIAALRALGDPRLTPVVATFASVPLDPAGYHLVTAQYALPFIPPDTFQGMVARVIAAVRPGGLFTGNFFGVRDAWNQAGSALTFLPRAEVETLLEPLDVVEFEEIEETVRLANGSNHAAHAFNVIARRV